MPSTSSHKRWLPLESNPDVINQFVKKLGLDLSLFKFQDVYGLDDELLQFLPQPVLALLLLYPIDEKSEKFKDEEEEQLKSNGEDKKELPEDVYYMKQTIGNACGTIGVLHAIGNNQELFSISENSFFQRFLASTKTMKPEERGQYLEHPPEGAPDIEDAHKEAAEKGDTAPPPLEEVVNLHFVCLVEKNGRLYELDGRKICAIDHGASSRETFVKDAVKVVKKFIERTESLNFNLISLAAAQAD
eukprot:TRINITY_DN10827_c0_g2_i3.p2 TRINITY_DN10827_c0_g2~~TRINITY_DN10827_c0_g2_i3.p2  ORF type:complete len:245 (-),score=58.49 TRINITY_DN10827_c0_g2_i3:1175-1909(-)